LRSGDLRITLSRFATLIDTYFTVVTGLLGVRKGWGGAPSGHVPRGGGTRAGPPLPWGGGKRAGPPLPFPESSARRGLHARTRKTRRTKRETIITVYTGKQVTIGNRGQGKVSKALTKNNYTLLTPIGGEVQKLTIQKLKEIFFSCTQTLTQKTHFDRHARKKLTSNGR